MRKGICMVFLSVALLCLFIISGCGKKADEDKPLTEIKAEAASMNVDDLRKMTLEYKRAIHANLEKLGKIKNKIKGIPVKEVFGAQAKDLKQELAPIINSINELKKRFWVYYSELKKRNADLSGLEL